MLILLLTMLFVRSRFMRDEIVGNRFQSSNPLETYDRAIWALVQHFVTEGIEIDRDALLPFPARLVAQIYWVNEGRVMRDLIKAIGEIRG